MRNRSVEQMCRDLLEQAVKSGLVGPSPRYTDPDPQCRTAGDLAGMANLLTAMLLREARNARAAV